jgi:O-antigen/teichoic acid export membrane protein
MCLIPSVAAVATASGLLLRAFGAAYAAEARHLLVLLSLAAFAVGLNTWAGFALKLVRRMGHLIVSNMIYMVVTVGLACLLVHHGVVGVGWAWLIGNAVSGLYAAAALFGGAAIRRSTRPHDCPQPATRLPDFRGATLESSR